MDNNKIFKEHLEEASNDSNVIGFFLNGSRGKNRETKYSDYDIEVIVKDRVINQYKRKYKNKNKFPFSFSVFSISEFTKHAELGSPTEWSRASYTHISAIIDKTGKIQKLINNKGIIPKSKIKKYVSGHLDGYVNHTYRSLKCFRDGNIIGARLEASRAVHALLKIIFGLEGRTTPYYKYLRWELEKHPLKKFSMNPQLLTDSLLRILQNGDVKTQQRLFVIVEKLFRKENYSDVFNSWEKGSIKLIKSLKK